MQGEHHHWSLVGATIKRFHNENIYHADLNAHNILLSNERIYLIDFDKGQKMSSTASSAWKQDNLARLQRSLNKLQQQKSIKFSEGDWQQLLLAYQKA